MGGLMELYRALGILTEASGEDPQDVPVSPGVSREASGEGTDALRHLARST